MDFFQNIKIFGWHFFYSDMWASSVTSSSDNELWAKYGAWKLLWKHESL